MPGALVNCQRRNLRSLASRNDHASALTILSKAARQSCPLRAVVSRRANNEGFVSRDWPPSACGKLTARQPRERMGVPRLK